jgi:hypothetical protein
VDASGHHLTNCSLSTPRGELQTSAMPGNDTPAKLLRLETERLSGTAGNLKRKASAELLGDEAPSAKSTRFEQLPLGPSQYRGTFGTSLDPPAYLASRQTGIETPPVDDSSHDAESDSPVSQAASSSADTTLSESGSAYAEGAKTLDDNDVSPKTCLFP